MVNLDEQNSDGAKESGTWRDGGVQLRLPHWPGGGVNQLMQ